MSKIDKNSNISITIADTNRVKEGSFKDFKFKKRSNFNIFVLILFILIFISLSNYLKSGNLSTLTFKSLLEFLANAPSFDISWSLIDINLGDWGMFNFIRGFINIVVNIFEVLVMLFGMICESLEFLLYLVKGLLFL